MLDPKKLAVQCTQCTPEQCCKKKTCTEWESECDVGFEHKVGSSKIECSTGEDSSSKCNNERCCIRIPEEERCPGKCGDDKFCKLTDEDKWQCTACDETCTGNQKCRRVSSTKGACMDVHQTCGKNGNQFVAVVPWRSTKVYHSCLPPNATLPWRGAIKTDCAQRRNRADPGRLGCATRYFGGLVECVKCPSLTESGKSLLLVLGAGQTAALRFAGDLENAQIEYNSQPINSNTLTVSGCTSCEISISSKNKAALTLVIEGLLVKVFAGELGDGGNEGTDPTDNGNDGGNEGTDPTDNGNDGGNEGTDPTEPPANGDDGGGNDPDDDDSFNLEDWTTDSCGVTSFPF